MAKSQNFRDGKATVYFRGQVWHLRHNEQGKRHRVRAWDDKTAARQLAQVNAQIETGAPAAASSDASCQKYDEHVLQSSVAKINRHRTASDHLLNFVMQQIPNKRASRLGGHDAEANRSTIT